MKLELDYLKSFGSLKQPIVRIKETIFIAGHKVPKNFVKELIVKKYGDLTYDMLKLSSIYRLNIIILIY